MTKKKTNPNFPQLQADEKCEYLGWLEDMIDDDEPTLKKLLADLTILENNKGPVLVDLSMGDRLYRVAKKTKADYKKEAKIQSDLRKWDEKELKELAKKLGYKLSKI